MKIKLRIFHSYESQAVLYASIKLNLTSSNEALNWAQLRFGFSNISSTSQLSDSCFIKSKSTNGDYKFEKIETHGRQTIFFDNYIVNLSIILNICATLNLWQVLLSVFQPLSNNWKKWWQQRWRRMSKRYPVTNWQKCTEFTSQ